MPEFLSDDEADWLAAELLALEYHEVRMRGQAARRTVVHYGWQYDFDSWQVSPGPAIPALLEPLREKAALLTGIPAVRLEQAQVARYPEGASIGWHRDATRFGPVVVGVSLLSPCRMRFRRGPVGARQNWEIELAPRSAYVLSGAARSAWQHSIPPVPALRLSVTFRTVRPDTPSTR